MADYIYLLETRLNPAQREALKKVRDVSRAHGLTVFLVGGAVRDLASGMAIRDLDVTVQGNALKLKKDLEKAGGKVVGTNETFQALYLSFPGGVRIEVATALTITYPKPGRPVAKSAGILDDLRGRDFTANAMAVSLNEGSYGLLMDPLNGMADIENRELRLVSNYGFIEEPSRMIRAARLVARLGWVLEERTQQRYETGKAEDYISALGSWEKSYELEEIFHEDDPLRIARRLEAEGWSKVLFPQWTAARANEADLERLRDVAGQLNMMAIYPDSSAALFPLLTAKLGSKETAALKNAFARPGFVEEIESLEGRAKAFAAQMGSKEAATPSAAWKMIYAADPQAVLSLVFGTKSAPLQQKFKRFFEEWPQARNKIPYALMHEMRITPELPEYNELLQKLFFAIMDAKLETPEAARAFLEPYSPPAPPPPPNLRRRPAKRESKAPKKPAKAAKAVAAAPQDGAAVAAAPAKAAKAGNAAAEKPAVKAVAAKKAAAPAAPSKAVKVPAKKVVAKKPAKTAAKKPIAKKAVKKAAPAKKAAAKKPAKSAKGGAKKPVSKKAVKKAPAKKKVAAKKGRR
jgi:tRNA nucleotidyltransferase/poly(A) polymerase